MESKLRVHAFFSPMRQQVRFYTKHGAEGRLECKVVKILEMPLWRKGRKLSRTASTDTQDRPKADLRLCTDHALIPVLCDVSSGHRLEMGAMDDRHDGRLASAQWVLQNNKE